ncbi:MAG: acetylxylan esterase [Candidatus Hydrogenedentes bacterium]|nr:acetylxylan esterase [Candidatus Hydrogenedentota bacterium]
MSEVQSVHIVRAFFYATVVAVASVAQGPDPAKVPTGPSPELPNPLVCADGSRVETRAAWQERRGEIAELLLSVEYGHMPPAPGNLRVEDSSSTLVLDGAAELRRATVSMGPENKASMRVACYLPSGGKGPYPVVLALEPVWEEHLLPVAKKCLDAGNIFAGYERHDLDRDDADRSDGVHPLYPEYDWASLAVWAWGAMRMVDYLATQPEVDAARIVLTGHSRAGKAALLAGALDERIAVTVPHASGAGGAGSYLIVERGVETLALITEPARFHYWFHPRLAEFAGKEKELPFDQHYLRALVAPRALLSIDGLEDQWANPKGTDAMYRTAQPVFDLLGAEEMNAAYFRPGGHDTTMEDWDVLLEFANHVLNGAPQTHDLQGLRR